MTVSTPRKQMNAVTLAFMVVAMASPILTVVATVPLMIGLGNGIGAPGMFLLVTGVMLVFAVGFAAMANAVPSTGGFMGFIGAGFGPRAGMAAGFVATGAYVVLAVYVAAIAAHFARSYALTRLGLDLNWIVWAVIIVLTVATLNRIGVREGAVFTAIIMTAEVVIVLLLALFTAATKGVQAFPMSSFSLAEVLSGSPGLALAFAILAFIGFEVTAVFTRHVRNPRRAVGQATLLGVVIIGATYTLGSWAIIAGAGPEAVVTLAQGPSAGNLTSDVAGRVGGNWLAALVQVVFVSSAGAVMIAVFNTSAQYLLNLGRVFDTAGSMARMHPRSGSPLVAGPVLAAILIVTLVACYSAGLDPYAQVASTLGVLGATAIIGLEVVCAAAIFAYFQRQQDARTWTTRVFPALAFLALVACFIVVMSYFGSLTGQENAVVAWSPLLFVFVAAVGWFVGRSEHVLQLDAEEMGSAHAAIGGTPEVHDRQRLEIE